MLILSRKTDEEILINSDITIKIVSIGDGKVKIGISAPGNVKILRGEIYNKVKESTIEALSKSKLSPEDISKLKINKIKG